MWPIPGWLMAKTLNRGSKNGPRIMPDEAPTNTASGSNEKNVKNVPTLDIDDYNVIVNVLATVVEDAGNKDITQITSPAKTTHHYTMIDNPNGNHDSRHVASNVQKNSTIAVATQVLDRQSKKCMTLKPTA